MPGQHSLGQPARFGLVVAMIVLELLAVVQYGSQVLLQPRRTPLHLTHCTANRKTHKQHDNEPNLMTLASLALLLNLLLLLQLLGDARLAQCLPLGAPIGVYVERRFQSRVHLDLADYLSPQLHCETARFSLRRVTVKLTAHSSGHNSHLSLEVEQPEGLDLDGRFHLQLGRQVSGKIL